MALTIGAIGLDASAEDFRAKVSFSHAFTAQTFFLFGVSHVRKPSVV
jgi:hypothetical protein